MPHSHVLTEQSTQTLPMTLEWVGDLNGHVSMIDQTLLPGELRMIECRDKESVWKAIKRLSVRGAPAIGVAAAMGVVLGVRDVRGSRADFDRTLDRVCEYLAGCRPTAVNLQWALTRMKRRAADEPDANVEAVCRILLAEAQAMADEDISVCRAIGEAGKHLIREGMGVLTHCNAGSLATVFHGTALSVMYAAHRAGTRFHVFADETRPLLQGSRLTAWELKQAGVPVTVICDNMAATLMKQGRIDLVITGADRVARNGDAANKIGTYGVAVLAKAHNIPMYIAAPSSTFDLATPNGDAIPIEERDPAEIRQGFGKQTAPDDVPCYCPAFDVTPAGLLAGLITERGMIQPITESKIVAQITA